MIDEEADEEKAQSGSFQALVHIVVCNYGSTSICLTNGNLEDKCRNGNYKDRDEIRYEPLEAIIVVDHGRITKEISHSSTTTHACE
jgi:hypothetical protein